MNEVQPNIVNPTKKSNNWFFYVMIFASIVMFLVGVTSLGLAIYVLNNTENNSNDNEQKENNNDSDEDSNPEEQEDDGDKPRFDFEDNDSEEEPTETKIESFSKLISENWEVTDFLNITKDDSLNFCYNPTDNNKIDCEVFIVESKNIENLKVSFSNPGIYTWDTSFTPSFRVTTEIEFFGKDLEMPVLYQGEVESTDALLHSISFCNSEEICFSTDLRSIDTNSEEILKEITDLFEYINEQIKLESVEN